MSFSGVKSSLRRLVMAKETINEQEKCNLAASLQDAIASQLWFVSSKAMQQFSNDFSDMEVKNFAIAGGVAANQYIRQGFDDICLKNGFNLIVPSLKLCTDNAAMVAWAGYENYKLGNLSPIGAPLRPRWGLTELQES